MAVHFYTVLTIKQTMELHCCCFARVTLVTNNIDKDTSVAIETKATVGCVRRNEQRLYNTANVHFALCSCFSLALTFLSSFAAASAYLL